MKWPLERAIMVGGGLASLIMSLVAVLAYLSLTQSLAALESRNQSLQTIDALEQTLTFLAQAETSQRGYLITGEPRFLESYQLSLDQLDAQLDALHQVSFASPQQSERLRQLDAMLVSQQAELRQTIDLYLTQGSGAARQSLLATPGQGLTDGIRALITEMKAAERLQLDQNVGAMRTAGATAAMVIAMGSVLAAGLITGSGVVIWRRLTERQQMQEALRRSRDELEQRVAERTAELERANAQLQRVNRLLKTLTECNQIMMRAADEATLLNEICQAAVAFGGFRLAWVGLAEDSSGKDIRPVAWAGHEAGYLDEESRRFAALNGECPAQAAMRHNRPVVIDDIARAPHPEAWRAAARARGYASLLSVPLLVGAQPVGVLSLYSDEVGAFANAAELNLMTELAHDLSHGLSVLRMRGERERTEERLRQHAVHAIMLAEISRAVDEAQLNAQRVLKVIAHRLAELIGDVCVIRLLTPEGQWLEEAALHGVDPESPRLLRALLASGLDVSVLQTGQLLFLPTPSQQDVRADLPPESWHHLDQLQPRLHSLLILPLRAQGRPTGLLAIARVNAGHAYSLDEQVFLQNAADSAALAITNARLFAEVQQELARRQQAETEIRQLNSDLERRVAERTAQLEIANRELQQAQQDAERANHAKSDFLSRMSHELRTPLNAILGFAQVLELGDLNPRQQKAVSYILSGGRHLLGLINEVLDITRIETGRMSISPEPVRVSEIVAEALDLVHPLAAERGITLRTHSLSHAFVRADRQRLKQVMLNLLSNAIKYNRVRGSVSVACEARPENRLRLLVQDTGPGIPPEKLARVFVPFDRLGAEFSGVEGTGLGLALSQRLVEAMGGQIGVESTVGRGSLFWIELAVVEGPVERLKRTGPLRSLAPAQAEREHTILYVEDNLSNLRLVEEILALRPGIKLLTAMQARLAVDLAREHQPAIILLDLNLPDVSAEGPRRARLSHQAAGYSQVLAPGG